MPTPARKSAALLAAVVLGATTVGTVAGPTETAQAQPAEVCTTSIVSSSLSITPRPITVLATGYTRQTTSFRVHDTCIDSDSGQIDAVVGYSDGNVDFFFSEPAQVDPLGSGEFDVYLHTYFGTPELGNADITVWSPLVQVAGSSAIQIDGPTFRLRRAAQLTTAAGPSTVIKKHQVTITGLLTRANLDTGANGGYAHQAVALQFRTPKGGYRTVRSVTTDASGRLKTKRAATKSGCYRWLFTGDRTTASVTGAGSCFRLR